jgi:hypothetical protein
LLLGWDSLPSKRGGLALLLCRSLLLLFSALSLGFGGLAGTCLPGLTLGLESLRRRLLVLLYALSLGLGGLPHARIVLNLSTTRLSLGLLPLNFRDFGFSLQQNRGEMDAPWTECKLCIVSVDNASAI